uniref:Diphthine--ammonia ligase n=2 Tax=Macrostomum lignano TaxID=282301 RepID=A0A1I8JE38_9PLAT
CAISYNKMKVVGLVSGGKDSCYNMIECVRSGHQIVALAHLYPPSGAEMDSFMYQTVGSEAVALYAKATGLPLYTRPIVGESRDTGSADHYASSSNSGDSEDEVEDLYKLLAEVKAGIPGLQAVSVGAILSNYQRVRVESVCERLDLQVLAFLWRRDQTELLDEMLFSGLDAILIKVAAYGLSPKRHLGRRLVDIRDELVRLAAPAAGGLSPCGEGGEYETLALDCPLFKHGRIVLDNGHLTAAGTDSRVVVHSDDAFAPVCYLKLTGCCRLGEPK